MNSIFGALSLAERGLGYHLRRHELLLSNVANAQTPGYRPHELQFREVLDGEGAMVRTNETHLQALPPKKDSADEDVYEDVAISPAPDGNAVSMERQLAKLAANSLRFRATTELLNRRMALLRYAANDGR